MAKPPERSDSLTSKTDLRNNGLTYEVKHYELANSHHTADTVGIRPT